MRLTIGDHTYDRLKSLTFAPESDLLGQSLPINEFSADIITDDAIAIGQYALLLDDLGNLWAKYWIVHAEHMDRHTLRLRARSPLWLLEGDPLPATMYQAAPIEDVLIEIFANTGAPLGIFIYDLDPAFAGATLTGFCPRQTARQRLLWVCFALGICVKSSFADKLLLRPVDQGDALIPPDRVFWKPSVTYGDHVTALSVTAYSFTPGTPGPTDRWVKDSSGAVYIISEQTLTLSNPNAPAGAPRNVVAVDGVTLLGPDTAAAALSRLARWHFRRARLDLDVVHNGDFAPGDRVTACADDDTYYTGHIESCDFAFGVQSRARLRLLAVETTPSAALEILYTHSGVTLARDRHALPVGYAYDLDTRFIDLTMDRRRTVYRPTLERVTGTLTESGATQTVPCDPALELYEGTLTLHSVDQLTPDEAIVILT